MYSSNSTLPAANSVLQGATVGDAASRWSLVSNGIYILSFIIFVRMLGKSLLADPGNAKVNAPIVGPKNLILARFTFFKNAISYVESGYAKVGFQLLAFLETRI
jgi:hypothetical protein